MSVHHYSVFGLNIESELSLPELLAGPRDVPPDVVIRHGPVECDSQEFGLHALDGTLVLVVPGVGRFSIAGGKEITVASEPSAPERNVRLYLLGSAFGALLHQRGLLPLHANAVEIDGKAYAFMGASGAGKSTLAAWFHDRAYRVIADDVCVISFDAKGRPWACPGLPRLRLWEEALEASGREASAYPLSYVGDPELRKYDVSVSEVAREPRELGSAFLLEKGDEFAISKLGGVAAADVLFANTYRGRYVSTVNGEREHWSASMGLVRRTPVYRLQRAWGLDRLDEQGERILKFIRG